MLIDGGGVLVLHLGRESKVDTYTLLFRPSCGCLKDNYLARHTREYIHVSDLVQSPRSMPPMPQHVEEVAVKLLRRSKVPTPFIV